MNNVSNNPITCFKIWQEAHELCEILFILLMNCSIVVLYHIMQHTVCPEKNETF